MNRAASPGCVVLAASADDAADAARRVLGRRRAARATVIGTDEPDWLARLPDSPRREHIVVVAGSWAELPRLLPAVRAAGATRVLSVVLLPARPDSSAPAQHPLLADRPPGRKALRRAASAPAAWLRRTVRSRVGATRGEAHGQSAAADRVADLAAILSVPGALARATEVRVRRLGADGVAVRVHLARAQAAVALLARLALARDALARGHAGGGLQITAAGAAAARWVAAAGDPRARLAAPDWLGELQQRAGRSLDLLLLDPGWAAPSVRDALAVEAEALGAGVVWLGPGTGGLEPGGAPAGAERVASRAAPARAEVVAPPPVDIRVCNPIGFAEEVAGGFAALPTAADAGTVAARLAALDPAAGAGGPLVAPRPAWRPLAAAEITALRTARAVVDEGGWHDRPVARAWLLAQLAAAGVPVLAHDLDAQMRDLLGAALADGLAAVSAADLADPLTRARHSLTLRRAAWLAHRPEARWRDLRRTLGLPLPSRRSISVVLATNRPDHLDHAIAQVAAQHHPAVEVAVALHGEAFPDDVERRLHDAVSLPLTIVRVPAGMTLGDALNAATGASSGELVSKMDDDDWYGPEHLTDLELAWSYSGAALVGKAAEFVHLGELDVTIRRFAGGAEAWNDRVAGGALLLARADLVAAGGWRRARRAVDRLLIDDVRAAGGDVYRTHGFGFVLTRRGSGHTWDAEVAYFLRQSGLQRRGLDRVAAGLQ